MKKQLLKSMLMAVVGAGLLVGSAMAVPMTGEVKLTGNLALTGGSTFETKTGINFLDYNSTADLNLALISSASGDLAFLTGQDAQMTDFTFNTFTGVSPLWINLASGYKFNLESLNIDFQGTIATVSGTPVNYLLLSGEGTLYGGSFDPTPGKWTLSTQGFGNPATLSWSSTTVPEPATMLLFGTGIAGLAGIARRRKTANKA